MRCVWTLNRIIRSRLFWWLVPYYSSSLRRTTHGCRECACAMCLPPRAMRRIPRIRHSPARPPGHPAAPRMHLRALVRAPVVTPGCCHVAAPVCTPDLTATWRQVGQAEPQFGFTAIRKVPARLSSSYAGGRGGWSLQTCHHNTSNHAYPGEPGKMTVWKPGWWGPRP